ncbi:helix-turn-helix domain-containing protein [Roseiconus nitratireducens]|uniref:Helix-turn-helix domain-containing protein n=1 Tax=Roseiconus nitratireducens TaxID=2605748 RepID=A0A5M6DA77_9BACT|nr:helix-turn-helix domain-containing protein [Roseiconus nitratireducens]KAA5544468.1 helix-turn-helix domain-containing protein [Roseiconus nitratireducens]
MSYLSLEEAAAKLGISTDRLVELRSQGEIRGFRDGSSWKFPENEIDRLGEELAAEGAGSGILVDDASLGGDAGGIGSVIGGDAGKEGGGSDVNIGSENLKEGSTGGSDVNLVAGSKEDGSDVKLVAGDSGKDELEGDFETEGADLVEIDSAELSLNDPAIIRDDDDSVDVAIDPKEGSTGPVPRQEIEAAGGHSTSSVELGGEGKSGEGSSGSLSFENSLSEEDSDELVLGEDSEDSLDLEAMVGEDTGGESGAASSLEMMGDLGGPGSDASKKKSGADVLSELDLLSAEQSGSGSGLISGDSESLLTSSGLGSGLDSSVLGEMDDALDEDDDLVIADDDEELLLDSVSDISVAGDSGINLMSPSDSGLSLESEPLDLAGSSLSALDLGAELTDGSGISGSGSGSGSKKPGDSAVDLQSGDEEFQLSPSGVGLDGDLESSSQVIEVEDSEVAEAVDLEDDFNDAGGFAEADFAEAEPLGDDAFGSPDDALDAQPLDEDAVAIDDSAEPATVGAAPGGYGYEIPFSLMQCLSLMFIILTLSLGGMLMTDLVRNMWSYSEMSAPVSSLTDSLIGLMGWDS